MTADQEIGGRVAVVTGAATGIGLAIARRLASAGARVWAVDLAVPDTGDAGDGLEWYGLDVTDEVAVTAAASVFGDFDILVNCAAATTPQTTIEHLALADWRRALDVNVTGAFLMCRIAIPAMRRRGEGAILNIGSQLSIVGMRDRAAYCASKGAMAAFTRALALDHAAEGIRVNTLSPGAVATERLVARHGSIAAGEAKLAAGYPAGRIGRPEEIAEAALFMVSGRSAFMHGANILIDGGFSIQ